MRVAETEYLDGRRVPKSGTEREIPADLVLLALGFTGAESDTLDEQLRVPFDDRGNVERDGDYQTSESGVFVAGDAGPRAVAHRLGDRRGPRRGIRRRPVP